MTFGEAVIQMEADKCVRRAGWTYHLALQLPGPGTKMTKRFIYTEVPVGDRVPWAAGHTDLLAADWEVV